MFTNQNGFKKFLSLALVLSIILSQTACSSTPPTPVLSDPTSQILTENIEIENIETETIITETVLTEFITSEIYLEEIVVAENKISELLLEEETISEVILCKTIYVPQNNIEEFAKNSQTAQLFGDGVDILPLLAKVSLGTGVIITLTVLDLNLKKGPVASIVAAAADESLKFGETGAMLGSLFGGLTGAANEIDKSGRTSAVIGFATATAGMILSIVSFVVAVPSGGSTTITAAAGIKLVIAGVSVLAATTGIADAGHQAIKAFTATDASDIDWNNIDWKQVGASSAEKAIENAADGYMWGAIIGAVDGGAKGYDDYQKSNALYTQKQDRINQTPNGSNGKWSGVRGESDFILDEPIECFNGTKATRATYKNGVPDFSPYQKAQVKISSMTNNRPKNFRQADKVLAEYWTKIKYNGKSWTANDVELYRTSNNLTWHEMSNMESMQLIPREVNQTFTHSGGVAEYNAMVGQT